MHMHMCTILSAPYFDIITVHVLSCFLIVGPTKPETINPVLIRPVCNLLCFWSEKYKKKFWCGVNHEEDTMVRTLAYFADVVERNCHGEYKQQC